MEGCLHERSGTSECYRAAAQDGAFYPKIIAVARQSVGPERKPSPVSETVQARIRYSAAVSRLMLTVGSFRGLRLGNGIILG